MRSIVNFMKRILATVGFVGYIPGMPGTWASLLTVGVLWYFMADVSIWFTAAKAGIFWPAYAGFVAFCIIVCTGAREIFGDDDPSVVVLDEVAGQLITFFLIPLSLTTLIFGFLLFRFFDIVKPWPIHRFEELGDGEGIVMDDVVAGIMANITLLVIMALFHIVSARISG